MDCHTGEVDVGMVVLPRTKSVKIANVFCGFVVVAGELTPPHATHTTEAQIFGAKLHEDFCINEKMADVSANTCDAAANDNGMSDLPNTSARPVVFVSESSKKGGKKRKNEGESHIGTIRMECMLTKMKKL